MRATLLLIPAVFVCGALFLAAVAEDAAASAHAKKSDCAQCKATDHARQAPSLCGRTGPDRFEPNCG